MNALELRIPPLLVVAIVAAAMKAAAALWPRLAFSFTGQTALAAACMVAGAAIAISGVVAFRRAGTTVDPTRPDATSRIVASGAFKVTRNPMYLGFALALLGWTVMLGHPVGLPLLAFFVAYIDRFQIRPEERMLEARFGDDYGNYKRRVRRSI